MTNSESYIRGHLLDHEVLSKEEEQQLFKDLEQGDEQAREEIIKHNFRLVASIVDDYKNASELGFDDLFQVGVEGLNRAITKFDREKGFKFSTYASWWIYQKIQAELDKQSSTIRIPAHVELKLQKIKRIKKAYKQEHDSEPSVSYLADKLDIAVGKLRRILQNTKNTSSLDTKLNKKEPSGKTKAELQDSNKPGPADIADKDQRSEKLNEAMNELLTWREEQIVQLRHGLPDGHERLLRELAHVFNVCHERIRQLEERALEKLEEELDEEELLAHKNT